MNKKIVIIGVLLILFYGLRVFVVNQSGQQRMPQVNVIEQGEKVVFYDVGYSVEQVQCFDSRQYADEYPEYARYCAGAETELLLVSLRLEFNEDEIKVLPAFDMWLKYGENITYYDIFFFDILNPQLSEGTYQSGDIILVPYTIFNGNLTTEHLKLIKNNNISSLGVELNVGTYPERFQLKITEIEDCR